MSIHPSVYIIGLLVVTFVTGVFTLVKLIISKEQKISDMRQQWIENIRKDISGFLGEIETLSRLAEAEMDRDGVSRFDYNKIAIFRNKHKSNYLRLNELGHRILLRLNKQEHEALIIRIELLRNTFYGTCEKVMDITKPIMKEITTSSQDIIKSVWEKVKQGEKIYSITRIMIIAILIVVISILVFSIICKIGHFLCCHLTTGWSWRLPCERS